MLFSDLHLRNDRRLALVTLGLLLALSVWFIQSDVALLRGEWSVLGRPRLLVRGVSIAVCAVGFFWIAQVRSRAEYRQRMLVVGSLIAWCIFALYALRAPASGLPMRTTVLLLALLYVGFSNSFFRQIAPPLLLTAALVALRTTRLRDAGGDVGSDLMALASLNALGIILVRGRTRLEADLDHLVAGETEARETAVRTVEELRLLKGTIPVCSECGRVRSEEGSWGRLDAYVRGHSTAQFSHGVCPRCLHLHYADLLEGGDPGGAPA